MLFKEKKGWEITEQSVTDELFFKRRRDLIKRIGVGTGVLAAATIVPGAAASQKTEEKYWKQGTSGKNKQ